MHVVKHVACSPFEYNGEQSPLSGEESLDLLFPRYVTLFLSFSRMTLLKSAAAVSSSSSSSSGGSQHSLLQHHIYYRRIRAHAGSTIRHVINMYLLYDANTASPLARVSTSSERPCDTTARTLYTGPILQTTQ